MGGLKSGGAPIISITQGITRVDHLAAGLDSRRVSLADPPRMTIVADDYSNPKSVVGIVVGISMAETLGVVCTRKGHTTRPI